MATFTGWTSVNSPTLTAETTLTMHGTQSMKMVAGGSVGQVYQALTVNIKELTTKTVHIRAWVYATATSTARIGLSFDGGSTFTYHDYHTGADQWEYQDLDVAIPSTATSIRVYLETIASGTAYFDLVVAWIDPINEYTLPTSIINGPYRVLYQTDEDEPKGIYLPYHPGAPAGRVLRLEGAGRLTVPTTLTGTVELDENRAELVVAQAALNLYQNPAWPGAGDAAERERKVRDLKEQVADLKRAPGIGKLFPAADERDYWSVPPRDTRQLILYR